jgi:hypothetical protein
MWLIDIFIPPKGSIMIHCLRPIRKREKVGVRKEMEGVSYPSMLVL